MTDPAVTDPDITETEALSIACECIELVVRKYAVDANIVRNVPDAPESMKRRAEKYRRLRKALIWFRNYDKRKG